MAGNLESQGYAILPIPDLTKKRKRVYYHPGTGLPTCLLPADPYHEKLFLKSGFTLEPPSSEVVPAKSKREYKHTKKYLNKKAQKIKVEKPINTLKGE